MEVMTLMATDRVPLLLDLPHSIILGHPGVTGVILEYRTVSLTDEQTDTAFWRKGFMMELTTN